MKYHVLKIQYKYLMDILYEGKSFEIRQDDRGYKVGDIIHFVDPLGNEFDNWFKELVFRITYILRDVPQYGLDKNYCILAIERMENKNHED